MADEEFEPEFDCDLCGETFDVDDASLAYHFITFFDNPEAPDGVTEELVVCGRCREMMTPANERWREDGDESTGYLAKCRIDGHLLRQDDEFQWVCPQCGTDFGDGTYTPLDKKAD
jgi:hypothetical protein